MEIIDNGTITSPKGYQASGAAAGIRKSKAKDLAIIYSEFPAKAVGAFTSNALAAASVHYCREIVKNSTTVRAITINSGNANSCTGDQGKKDTLHIAEHTAAQLDINADEVLVSSTGVIGVPLPMDNVLEGIEKTVKILSCDG